MTESFSRTQTPPGGWQFIQPVTNWKAPTPIASTFDQTVQLIIKHRTANPAATAKHNLSTNAAVVGNELENYTRMRLGLPTSGALSPKRMPPAEAPQLSGAVKSAVAAVVKLADGAALLLEWEQSGRQAVSPEVSAPRAAICAKCPENVKGKSLADLFTVPAAAMILRRFERLEGLKLTTPNDDDLGTCRVCLCPLRLKVHTPADLILKRLKPGIRAELHPSCWILKET